jgi:hypothetical protein
VHAGKTQTDGLSAGQTIGLREIHGPSGTTIFDITCGPR